MTISVLGSVTAHSLVPYGASTLASWFDGDSGERQLTGNSSSKNQERAPRRKKKRGLIKTDVLSLH